MPTSSSVTAAATASLAIPHTQNTAPVLEFRCLFTSDLKRKQKRWQDGRLKFHTHNNRIMVYDERANYVGDTHWREGDMLQEGEELQLERGGVMVEVSECIGKTDQDLTELVDKRLKEREERAAALAQRATPARGPQVVPIQPSKSLVAMLTPSGHHGRAVLSITSPFEDRRQSVAKTKEDDIHERPAKRQRVNESLQSKSGYAQNLVGATLNLSSSRPASSTPIRYEAFRPTITTKPPPIDLTLSGDEGVVVKGQGEIKVRRANDKPMQRRSPPSRSTFANTLTGVSLNLATVPARKPMPRTIISERSRDATFEDEAWVAHHGVMQMEQEGDTVAPGQVRKVSSKPERRRQDANNEEDKVRIVESRNPHTKLSEAKDTHGDQNEKRKLKPSKQSKPIPTQFVEQQEDEAPPRVQQKAGKSTRPKRQPFMTSDEESGEHVESKRPRGKIVKKQRLSKPPEVFSRDGSSSPPRRRDLQASSSDIARKKAQSLAGAKHDSQRAKSTSSLRIKSKPPRQKMMMMLETPRPRSLSTAEPSRSNAMTASRSVSERMRQKDAPVMSQGSAHMQAFQDKERARLDKRLQGKKKSKTLEQLFDSDEKHALPLSVVERKSKGPALDASYPSDTQPKSFELQSTISEIPHGGIDHIQIDRLLSRKSSRSETGHLPQPAPTKSQTTMRNEAGRKAEALANKAASRIVAADDLGSSDIVPSDEDEQEVSGLVDSPLSPHHNVPLLPRQPPHTSRRIPRNASESDFSRSSSPAFEPAPSSIHQSLTILALKESTKKSEPATTSLVPPKPRSPESVDLIPVCEQAVAVEKKRLDAGSKPWLSKSVPDLTVTRHHPQKDHCAEIRAEQPIMCNVTPRQIGKEAQSNDTVAESPSIADYRTNVEQNDVEMVAEITTSPTTAINSDISKVDGKECSSATAITKETSEAHVEVTTGHGQSIGEQGNKEDKDGGQLGSTTITTDDNTVIPSTPPIQQLSSSPSFPISPPTTTALQEQKTNTKTPNQNGGIQSATSRFRSMLSSIDSPEKSKDGSRKTILLEKDPLLSVNDKVIIEEGVEVTHGRLSLNETGVTMPGQSTMELAEGAGSSIDMALIPSFPASSIQAPVAGRRLLSNPATTRTGRSLSELAASTRDAPSFETTLSFVGNNNNNTASMMPAPQIPTLQNVNQPLLPMLHCHKGSNMLQNLPSFESRIAKRIYPPAPPRRAGAEKTLNGDQQNERQESLPERLRDVLLLGGATKHLSNVRQSAENGGGLEDGSSSGNCRENGIGTKSGPWCREAFDLFGCWLRP